MCTMHYAMYNMQIKIMVYAQRKLEVGCRLLKPIQPPTLSSSTKYKMPNTKDKFKNKLGCVIFFYFTADSFLQIYKGETLT